MNQSYIEQEPQKIRLPNRIPNQFIPILVRYSLDEVFVATAVLNDCNIICYAPDEAILTVHPWYGNAIGGVRVLVDRNDFDRAKEILITGGFTLEKDIEILRNKHDIGFKVDDVYLTFRLKEIFVNVVNYPFRLLKILRSNALSQFFKGVFALPEKHKRNSILCCPNCHSENVYRPKFYREAIVLLYLATSLPLPLKSNRVFCFNCRETFYFRKNKEKLPQ